jgi:ABC-type branched-subunit amino acid transport system substrate-binding protein
VFFLGEGTELKDLLAASKAEDWNPYVLLPGSAVQSDIFTTPSNLASKVLLAFPALPTDWSREGIAAFNTLRQKSGFSTRHLATQVTAYCSAQLLVQGLKLVGRHVSRWKLISALEGLHDFETGLTPRLSYGPNQHIGAPGAYVVTIDPINRQFKPLSDWIVPK